MSDSGINDFTFCRVDSQAVNDQLESPKGIPDVRKITLKDNFSYDGDLRNNNSTQDKSSSANSINKYVPSSGFPLYGSSDIPQNFKSNVSPLLEAKATREDSVHVVEEQKPVLRKPPVRAKVPFEKGYSQMDWLKLTQTHPDLAGLKGQSNRRLFTMDEVRQHKIEGSIWTVLKGRVYNISPYMKFHPGALLFDGTFQYEC